MKKVDVGEVFDQLLSISLRTHLARITEQLIQKIGFKVQAGPFAQMMLGDEDSRHINDLASKLLGYYEAELHPSIEKAISRRPEVVINVGASEGYFAVGLALRLPQARVYAFDVDQGAQKACAAAAKLNGVADRLVVGGECGAGQLAELAAGDKPEFLLMDCEGAELQLLDAAAVASLKHCDLIIECHDFVDRSITPTLTQRLQSSHDIEIFREAGRDPSANPLLQTAGTFERWLLVCEFRPEVMHWIVCWSKSRP